MVGLGDDYCCSTDVAACSVVLNEISCNYTLPTFPAASPYVLAIGGLQMLTNDTSGQLYVLTSHSVEL
jgi:subtilase family serine protease